MNVLIIGSGGREHAFAWKIAQSPLLSKLFIAPGNAGTQQHGTNLNISPTDFDALAQAVAAHNIELIVVGPEAPLVEGITDYFAAHPNLSHVPVIGPGAKGAALEGSKEFAKAFMARHAIPTAAYQAFTAETLAQGQAFLETLSPPYVLKADGLAAGKGVLILNDLQEAKAELAEMLDGKFGGASQKVVIEAFLDGIELSVFVLTDGTGYVILPEAKDYKRIGEGDTGLNTGGMGAISPVPFAAGDFLEKVEKRIVQPTIEGFKADGIPYKGFVFIGLMNVKGDPYVVEYNVRMGDPETEVVLPRIASDLLELLAATGRGELSKHSVAIDPRTATTVMLVSGGYPGNYEKGKTITGLDQVQNSTVFHAGTRSNGNNVETAGGRVLAITSLANEMQEALSASYVNAENVQFEGVFYRKDIGFDL